MRPLMKIALLILIQSTLVWSVPALQLYIDGADYEWETETWIIEDQLQFDLYVVGAIPQIENVLDDVKLVISASGESAPTGVILVNGQTFPQDDWVFGSPPFPPEIPHGIFPAWHLVLDAGDFHSIGGVGDIIPDSSGSYFDPSEGYIDDINNPGEIRLFSIEILDGLADLHFDAYQISNGAIERFAPFSHDAGYRGAPLGVGDDKSLTPTRHELLTAYPNPFNSSTTIVFTLPVASDIRLELYELTGRRVRVLASGRYEARKHSVSWDGYNGSGKRVATGIYLVRLDTGAGVASQQIMLLK